MSVTAVKHERSGPFRIGCGEQNRHRGAFGGAQQRRTAAAGRIHDGANIVHPGFEVWQIAIVDPVAEAGTTFVELDESCKGAEPLEQVAVARVFPVNFEIGKKPRHKDEIDRAVADHLIGDPHLAAAGISGLGRFHKVWGSSLRRASLPGDYSVVEDLPKHPVWEKRRHRWVEAFGALPVERSN